MTNPLIEKYNEIHNPKPPEPPKPVEKPKLPIHKTFDRDDLKVSFQQVADKIQQGKAQVANMSMEIDSMSIMRNKIIFEVYVDD
jgi:anthranilate/para-aminobenzoate synthase component I